MREIGRHAWLHVGMTWKEALNSGLGKSLGLQLVSRETLAQIRAQEQVQAQLAQAASRTEHPSTPAPKAVKAEDEGEGEGEAAQHRTMGFPSTTSPSSPRSGTASRTGR